MDIFLAEKQFVPNFQLQNLPKCAILSWHAGIAPEIGFSAPSMEQLWWIVLKCNQAIITQTASLICTLYA